MYQLYYFYVIITVTFCAVFAVYVENDEEKVGSPLRVAQCRASCLEKFTNHTKNTPEFGCRNSECVMCWLICELPQSEFGGRDMYCENKNHCDKGCKEACNFYAATTGPQQSQPVIRTQGESAVRLQNGRAYWPRPPHVSINTPLVYIVMYRQSTDGAWRQLTQTSAQSTLFPPSSMIAQLGEPLRVLAVDPRGLVTIYSPITEVQNISSSQSKNSVLSDVKTKNEKRISTPTNKWTIREISLIHQKFLVISEIEWEPKVPKGLYLVTWEVDGGGLKGNLFTDSTTVTLSLWPDTIYHIQVELVSRETKTVTLKSEILDLDTRRNELTENSKEDIEDEDAEEDDDDEELEEENDDFYTEESLQNIDGADVIVTTKEAISDLRERSYRNVNTSLFSKLMLRNVNSDRVKLNENTYLEVLVGLGAAVIVFIVVIAGFFWIVKKWGIDGKTENLYDDEFETRLLPEKGYPVLTVITKGDGARSPDSSVLASNPNEEQPPLLNSFHIPNTSLKGCFISNASQIDATTINKSVPPP